MGNKEELSHLLCQSWLRDIHKVISNSLLCLLKEEILFFLILVDINVIDSKAEVTRFSKVFNQAYKFKFFIVLDLLGIIFHRPICRIFY